jgi:hypothetical protein
MGKLHELLAVETNLGNVSKKLVAESIKSLQKDNLFTGEVKIHKIYDEDHQHLVQPSHERTVTTTVKSNLEYTFQKGLVPYWDAVAQKDEANQRAKADVIVDGKTILEGIAGTTLLGLEAKLAEQLNLFNTIPTLAPGIAWELDPTQADGVYRNPQLETRVQNARSIEYKVIVEPTEHHPAQVREVEIITAIGDYKVTSYAGMITPKKKAEMIQRLQKLINAVKKARQRANSIDVKSVQVGASIADYLING